MDSVYAIPGAVALVEWFLAGTLYVVGWYRTKPSLNRMADGLSLAGLVTALAGVAWLIWDVSTSLALARSSLATGLAVSALTVHMILARRRTERLSTLLTLGFALPIQAYAVGRLWWKIEVVPPGVFLPVWMAFRTLTGLVGYGCLVAGAALIILSFTPPKMRDRLSLDRLATAPRLLALEWRFFRVALVALTVSLSAELIRSWWGLGQVTGGGFIWALTTWLLLTAGGYGLIQGGVPRRLAYVLLILACVAGVVAALTMAGPLAGAG